MQHMAGKVEGEGLFQPPDPREVFLLARFVELIQGLVGVFHVSLVVCAMVKLHDLARDVRFQGAEVVVEIGQDVGWHWVSLLAWSATRFGRSESTFSNCRS